MAGRPSRSSSPVAGSATRFVTTSALWLDEALSVNIATLPLGDIGEALRHDGHPPLYYLLLHVWTEVFGTGDVAVRSLSGVLAVLTLPWPGSSAGGRATPRWAGSPCSCWGPSRSPARYATEARMYALVMLLVFLGWLAVQRALEAPPSRSPGPGGPRQRRPPADPLLGLLPHRCDRPGPGRGRGGGRTGEARTVRLRVTLAVAAGGVLFLPWLPSFLEQARSTGTPWAEPERPTKVLAQLFADLGGVDNAERILFAMVLGLLLVLGLFGRGRDRHSIDLDLQHPAGREDRAPRRRPDPGVRGGRRLPDQLRLRPPLPGDGGAPRRARRRLGPPPLPRALATGLRAGGVPRPPRRSGIIDVTTYQRTQLDDLTVGDRAGRGARRPGRLLPRPVGPRRQPGARR